MDHLSASCMAHIVLRPGSHFTFKCFAFGSIHKSVRFFGANQLLLGLPEWAGFASKPLQDTQNMGKLVVGQMDH